MSSEFSDQLATLAREQGRLEALLDADATWRALQQLEAREAQGEPLSSVDGTGLKARLKADLAGNRLYQARTKILEAIAILTESAALPPVGVLAPAAEQPSGLAHAADPLAQAAAAPELPAGTEAARADKVEGAPMMEGPAVRQAEAQPAAPAVLLEERPIEVSASEPEFGASLELTAIRGIDAGLAAQLARLGTIRFSDMALWSSEDVQRVSAALGLGRSVSRQNWIEQAAVLALKAGQPVAPPVKVAVEMVSAPVETATAPPPPPPPESPAESMVSVAARSIAARIAAMSSDRFPSAAEPLTRAATAASAPQPDEVSAEAETSGETTVEQESVLPDAAVEQQIANALSMSERTDASSDATAGKSAAIGPSELNGSHPSGAAEVMLTGSAWVPVGEMPAPVAEALPLPQDLEERLSNLESRVAEATAEVAPAAALLQPPAVEPAPDAGRAAAPLPNAGVAIAGSGPEQVPRPLLDQGAAEAEVEVVRRPDAADRATGDVAMESLAAPRTPNFDASDYAAYRQEAEEASVEIVLRQGDQPQRTRLPGKPTRITREEQASAVRRFLAALNGK